LIISALILLLDRWPTPFIAWLLLLAYLRSPEEVWILDGPWARWAGKRSYAAFILHFSILLLTAIVVQGPIGLGGGYAIAAEIIVGVAATLIASELVYRAIEEPMI